MSIISPQVEKLIQDTMKQGGFATPDDVVRAGIASLQEHACRDDFEVGEMEDLLEQGEQSGDSLDGEEVLAELRALRTASQGKVG